jgi:hypothetical protein
MKTPSTFNLSKSAKRMLATYVDKHRRSEVKKILIQGEFANEVMAKTRGRPRDTGPTE